MSKDVMNRTVRMMVGGPQKRSADRGKIIGRLVHFLGQKEFLTSLWRTDTGDNWYATLQTTGMVEKCLEEQFCRDEDIVLAFFPCNRRKITVRIHWLPLWLEDRAIAEFLERFGKIIQISEETQMVIPLRQTYGTGVRRVTMEIRDGTQHDIPYRASICNRGCLITIPGRPPLCLKCGELGHFRAQCLRERPGSYADSVRKQPEVTQSSSSSDRDTSRDQPGTSATVEEPAPVLSNSQSQSDRTEDDASQAPTTQQGGPDLAPDTALPQLTQDRRVEAEDGMELSQDKREEAQEIEEEGEDDDDGDDNDESLDLSMDEQQTEDTGTPVEANQTKRLWATLKEKRKSKKFKKKLNKIKELYSGDVPTSPVPKLMSLLSPASSQVVDPSVVGLGRNSSVS